MRYRFLLFATALVAQSAVAQNERSASCNAVSCTMTLKFGPFGMIPTTAASAAYSGRESMENMQTLADGTHITRSVPVSSKYSCGAAVVVE